MQTELEKFRLAQKALDSKDLAAFTQLLDDGLNPNFVCPHNQTLLTHIMNRMGGARLEYLAAALAAGADVNLCQGEGNAPIHYATSPSAVRFLLDAGARLTTDDANTIAARSNGRHTVLELLRETGVEFEWEDSLRHVFFRCHSAEQDGLSLQELLASATPFVAKQIDDARRCLSGEVDIEYFYPLNKLYAANRINDVLINGLLPEDLSVDWPFERVSRETYVELVSGFGFQVCDPRRRFEPIYHEIVQVEQDEDDDVAPVVENEFWPAILLDISGPATDNKTASMVFSRAGVCVRAGRNHIDKATAETSRLYWAFRRANRVHHDQSHGWGSNSQWSTDIKLDVITDTHYKLNMDNRDPEDCFDLAVVNAESQEELDKEEISREHAIELLLNRCFVTPQPDRKHDDVYVYQYFVDQPIEPTADG